MAGALYNREAMFPTLDAARMERARPHELGRRAGPGEILFDVGGSTHGMFVVVTGAIEIVSPSADGEQVVAGHQPGGFTGEVNLLSGRSSLVRARVRKASELIEIPRANLRRLVRTDAELGEIFLRAFVLRRAPLIANSPGDVVLAGSAHSADTLGLRAFLSRNGHPGVSGRELADRALVQAQKFGANITIARAAIGLACSARPYEIALSDDRLAYGRSVIIAAVAAYRKLPWRTSGATRASASITAPRMSRLSFAATRK
jgi:CRP-like cAMP-binding protein